MFLMGFSFKVGGQVDLIFKAYETLTLLCYNIWFDYPKLFSENGIAGVAE